MRFMTKEMKDALTVIKRLYKSAKKDKEAARMQVLAVGDGRIHLRGVSADARLSTHHTITSLDDAEYAFSVNPFDLFNEVKGKNAEIAFAVNGRELKRVGSPGGYRIEPMEEDIRFFADGLKPLNDPDWFVQILKGAEAAMKKSGPEAPGFLKLTSEKAMAVQETQLHLFRVGETLPFDVAYLHQDVVAVLAASLKGPVFFGMDGECLVLENQGCAYRAKMDKKVKFPKLRQMVPVEREVAFTVDAAVFTEQLKAYTTKVSDLVVTAEGGELVLDPRNAEFPIQRIPFRLKEGGFRKVVFATDAMKSVFMGYSEEVTVEQQLFKNVYGEPGYLWKVYAPQKTALMAGIKEPDWDRQEQYFREGRIKELLAPSAEE